MTNKNFWEMILGGSLGLILLVICQSSQAQSVATATSASSSDAIAVRIVPNPNHYSIARWYASQGFEGSPQSLLVDGYDAIRDGRTVYINAANVDQASHPPLIYTNIYLISYNQNPAPNTVDILGQIIANWKFNSGLTDSANPSPRCSISSLSCSSNADCGSGQLCATSGAASSSCALEITKNCSVDADCPANFFCDSLKSKITRDIKRVGQLKDLQAALDNFKTTNGHYPILAAGTYLANNSVSLWPSWSQVLLSNLAVAQNSVDPINRLGACPDYDQATCWNKDTQQFYSKPSNTTLVLPGGSYALAYSTNTTGSSYNLCATLESHNYNPAYAFVPNDPAVSSCVVATGINGSGQSVNSAPQLTAEMLTGEAGQEFDGFIKVVDADGDPLTWSFNTSTVAWTGWQNNGQANQGPSLVETSNASQKKFYAQLAGQPGNYNVTLNVNDGRGGYLSTSTPITILSPDISIQAENAEYVLNSPTPFAYNLYFSGDGLAASNPNYSIVKTAGSGDLLAGLNKTATTTGTNSYQVSYTGAIPTNLSLAKGGSFTYKITVTDKYGHSSYKYFVIKITAGQVNLSVTCANATRVNQAYNCVLGSTAAGLTYAATGLPSGLQTNDTGIFGTPVKVGIYSITITATDQYGASASQIFTLQVNSYCGDGIKQLTNSEGKGGPNNDGHEDCDGTDGLTASVAASNVGLQYGCNTAQCAYQSSTAGGGYCGDGYCEVTVGNTAMENCLNCSSDCGNCAATIESYTKQEQMAYLNGQNIYKSVWPAEGVATGTLLSGKNIIGFWTHALNTTAGNYGLAYRVTVGPLSAPYDFLDTANSNLMCAPANAAASLSSATYDPTAELANWPSLNFSETSAFTSSQVLSPVSTSPLNNLNFIWGQTASTAATAFLCRLTYNYNTGTLGTCRPRCQGLQCGPDGCGGTCGTCGNNQACNPSGLCTTVACSSNSQCDDSNACTDDSCVNPGAYNAYCNHSNNNSSVSCSASFGTCTVAGTKTCSGGSYGSCSVVDPRPATCSGKDCGSDGCGGTCGTCGANQSCSASQKCVTNCTPSCSGKCYGAADGCGGTCTTGVNTACVPGMTVTCNVALGYTAGFAATPLATCNSTCTGYDTSACQIDWNYWYQAPDASYTKPNITDCMVLMHVDASNNIDCSDFPTGSKVQWVRGTIQSSGAGTRCGNTSIYCSVGSCGEINPDKCRWLTTDCPDWTGQCYVHK